MRMKTYAGRNLQEIVPQIRDELGAGAVILKQRPIRTGGVGGFFAKTGIEVLASEGDPGESAAAVAASAAAATATATATAVAPARTQLDTHDAESRESLLRETFAQALAAQVEPEEMEEYEEERLVAAGGGATARVAAGAAYGGRTQPMDPVRISATRTNRGRLRIAPEPLEAPPLDDESADLVVELERAGLTPAAADALVREVRHHVEPFASGRLRDLARRRIAARVRIEQGWEPDGTARRIAVVGASGVGKTTAIANLAAGYASAGMMVGDRGRRPVARRRAPRAAAPGRRRRFRGRPRARLHGRCRRPARHVRGRDQARHVAPLDARRGADRHAGPRRRRRAGHDPPEGPARGRGPERDPRRRAARHRRARGRRHAVAPRARRRQPAAGHEDRRGPVRRPPARARDRLRPAVLLPRRAGPASPATWSPRMGYRSPSGSCRSSSRCPRPSTLQRPSPRSSRRSRRWARCSGFAVGFIATYRAGGAVSDSIMHGILGALLLMPVALVPGAVPGARGDQGQHPPAARAVRRPRRRRQAPGGRAAARQRHAAVRRRWRRP